MAILQENQILYVSGYKMRATNVTFKCTNARGEDVYLFTGEILDDEVLKKTSYNKGSYSWRLSDNNIVPQNISLEGKRVA